MSFLITTKTAPNSAPETRVATGDRDVLMDAEYDRGAMSVTIVRLP